MSYDYMLVKADAEDDLTDMLDAAMSGSIGAVEEIKSALNAIYPSLEWGDMDAPEGLGMSGEFGRCDTAEFTLMSEDGGEVQMIFMTRCEREEVERVAAALGLAAIDQQTMEQFGGEL